MPHSTSATSRRRLHKTSPEGPHGQPNPHLHWTRTRQPSFFFKMPDKQKHPGTCTYRQKHAGQAKMPDEKKHGTASFQNAPKNNTPPKRNPLGTGKQAALLICGGSPSRSHFVIERFGCLWLQIMAPIGVPRNPNWTLIVLRSVAWGHGQLSFHIWQP